MLLQRTPHAPSFHVRPGNVLKALGQVEAAIQSYMTATTLRPDYSMAFYNLGEGPCSA